MSIATLTDTDFDLGDGGAVMSIHARVAEEFREMPGLRLTLPQASRMFSLDPARCRRVLEVLVRSGLLVAEAGVFRAADSGRR